MQDQVKYDVGNLKSPCLPFAKMKDGLFGFSKGCLHMNRWDELNHFFSKTGYNFHVSIFIYHFGSILERIFLFSFQKLHALRLYFDPKNIYCFYLMEYDIKKFYVVEGHVAY